MVASGRVPTVGLTWAKIVRHVTSMSTLTHKKVCWIAWLATKTCKARLTQFFLSGFSKKEWIIILLIRDHEGLGFSGCQK